MLKSDSSPSIFILIQKVRRLRAAGPAVCLLFALFGLLPAAWAQDFTMSMSNFTPFAVTPGQTSISTITLTADSGFSGTVDLTCTVTSTTQNATLPDCLLSPTSVMPTGSATATIVTSGATTQTGFTVSVTATAAPPATAQTTTLSKDITVLSVAPQYTLTVSSGMAPSSVHAGNGGQATITITPSYGYTGLVTLSCASISPVVTVPPICSFTYPSGTSSAIQVPQPNNVNSVILTVNTTGPITASAAHGRWFYAVWMMMPMLSLAGFGAATGGKQSRRAWGLLALFVVSASFLLMPGCGKSTTTTTTNNNGVTPNNTYTFTLSGVDSNGVASSNSTTPPTVTLTVN